MPPSYSSCKPRSSQGKGVSALARASADTEAGKDTEGALLTDSRPRLFTLRFSPCFNPPPFFRISLQ